MPDVIMKVLAILCALFFLEEIQSQNPTIPGPLPSLHVQKLASTPVLPSKEFEQHLILPICGNQKRADSEDEQELLLDGFSRPPHLRLRQQATHIGILPGVGGSADLVLTENGTIPMPHPEPTVPPEAIRVGDYTDESFSATLPVICSIKLEACLNCVIELEIDSPKQLLSEIELENPPKCDKSGNCFDLEIVEERAEQSIPYLARLAGAPDVYSRNSIWNLPAQKKIRTSGNSVLVVVQLRNVQFDPKLLNFVQKLLPIKVFVFDNTEIRSGRPSQSIFLINQTSIGFIESPRYPESYPRNVVKNYTLVNLNSSGFIRLSFDDFHVHFQSELKIIDSDGQELFNTRSEYRRPPALLSKSNKLTILFRGHDFTQLVGFRARYEFVEDLHWPDKPTRRNCDDYLEGYGGRISFDAQKSLVSKHVDCIWLIGRFPALSRTFDKIYLKIEQFQLKGVGLRLEVRKGPSSAAERVLMLFEEQTPTQLERKQPLDGFLTEDAVQPAFYIRLRGYVASNTGLSIVYTQFYRWATALCPGGDGEFHCDNSRCIKSTLQCDGYDNCGDASDEVCHVPDANYESPHIDIAGALTLVIGAVGIVVLLLTVVAIMSKLYRHRLGPVVARRSTTAGFAGTANAAMAHEAFCNELAPSIQTIGERRFYVLPDAQISVIEAPPTYDDAMKHPRVASGRSRSAMSFAYANEAYRRSRASTPDEAPAPPVRGASVEAVVRSPKRSARPSMSPDLPTSPAPQTTRPSSTASTNFPSSPSSPIPQEEPRPSSRRSESASRLDRSRSADHQQDDESWV